MVQQEQIQLKVKIMKMKFLKEKLKDQLILFIKILNKKVFE